MHFTKLHKKVSVSGREVNELGNQKT